MTRKLRNPIATSNKILSLHPIHEAIDLLSNLGYEAIELWPEFLDQQLKDGMTSMDKLKEALKENSFRGIIHCPLIDFNDRTNKFNICSKYAALRDKSLKMNLRAIDLAKELGFSSITIHPGHTDGNDVPADDDYWRLQIDAFRQLAKRAEERGVMIGLEPMESRPKEFITEPEHAQRLIHEVGSENIGITFDLIHAYTHGEDKPIEFLDFSEQDIIHFHVSGHTKSKTHVPFSMTEMSHEYLDKVFEHIVGKGYTGIISIEGHTFGIEDQTLDCQKKIVQDNIAFIHEELKSLHLE